MFRDWEYKSTGERVRTIIITGLIGAPVLYLVAFLLEFLICFCTCNPEPILSGNCVLGAVWTGDAFWGTFGVLSIGGIVIGIIYAIAVQAQSSNEERREKKQAEEKDAAKKKQREIEEKRKEEEARKAAELKLRQGYASEFQKKQDDVIRECEKQKRNSEEPLSYDPKATALQEKLWEAVNDVSIPLQRLADIVNDLEKRSAN